MPFGQTIFRFYRATLCQRGMRCRRVSVRPSVTSWHCTKTPNHNKAIW